MRRRGNAFLEHEARGHRQRVPPENTFLALETQMARGIERALDAYRDARDRASERLFNAIYGSEWTQAVLGLRDEFSAGGHI